MLNTKSIPATVLLQNPKKKDDYVWYMLFVERDFYFSRVDYLLDNSFLFHYIKVISMNHRIRTEVMFFLGEKTYYFPNQDKERWTRQLNSITFSKLRIMFLERSFINISNCVFVWLYYFCINSKQSTQTKIDISTHKILILLIQKW